ncbi:unnamed protein product [Paramecium sonneborni]|uniref:Uncharacterized protein n=1 Tax=Paramecium sonneborni TaxID=65129 RepID=A0A8S1RIV8_9CILI|nr:unnamed protein product [Paramecium sonneborni]
MIMTIVNVKFSIDGVNYQMIIMNPKCFMIEWKLKCEIYKELNILKLFK